MYDKHLKDLKAKKNIFPILILSLRGCGALVSHFVQPEHARMVHSPDNSAKLSSNQGKKLPFSK